MKPVIDYTLYLVTDRDLMSTGTLVEAVEAACAGGVTLVQLREKHVTREEYERSHAMSSASAMHMMSRSSSTTAPRLPSLSVLPAFTWDRKTSRHRACATS